jgi:hypothetical protein
MPLELPLFSAMQGTYSVNVNPRTVGKAPGHTTIKKQETDCAKHITPLLQPYEICYLSYVGHCDVPTCLAM